MKTKEKIEDLILIKNEKLNYAELKELLDNTIDRLVNHKDTRVS
ncbi:hypothetical protein [Clostridium botulinum]|nr:hypothetical protein [Clostridium botulinum]